MHWSSQPPAFAFHLSALHPTRARMGGGEIPSPWGEDLWQGTSFSLVTPSPLLAPCFWPFTPLFTWPVHVCCPWLWVSANLSLKPLPHRQIHVCTGDPAACFCCHFWSCTEWENTRMQSCKPLAVHLSILVNKQNILLMAHPFKRGILSRWTKALKREYH